MKIIGLMLTWNNLEFFRCALEQALGFCDEVILVEGCHSQKYPKRSTDGTCEYIETIKNHPKITIADFKFKDRYDKVARLIRQEFPKMSKFYKPSNWVAHCDDDTLFMEEDLPKLRVAMEKTESDIIGYASRNFFYNFRFNFLREGGARGGKKGIYYRITDGMRLKGISSPYYESGRPYSCQVVDGVTAFHYGHVKKPARMEARWVMSVEKGTKASIGYFEKWMSVSWNEDKDIFNYHRILQTIRPGEILNVYDGKHPAVLDSHPWRHVEDIRRIGA